VKDRMSSNESLKIGFQDDSVTIIDISESSTVAIVDSGHCQLNKVEAPTEGCLSLHFAIISYLNSSKFRGHTVGTRATALYYVRSFFSFLSSFNADEEVPLDLLSVYVQHLRQTHKDYGASIYERAQFVKRTLRWCCSESSPLRDSVKLLCRQYIAHAPNLQKPESKPLQPLSKAFSESPYNDTELLDSLKKLCIWIIHYEARMRTDALQIDGIRQLIDGMKLINIDKPPISFSAFSIKNKTAAEARILYGTIITKVRDSNNIALKERLVADIRHPFEEKALTEKQLNWVLDRSLMKREEGQPVKCRFSYELNRIGGKSKYVNRKDRRMLYPVGSFRILSIRHLLVPSDIECFAMQCLLSCEKMNASSIERLTLDDVVKSPQGIQFNFQKGRRPTNKRANISTVHALGSAIGKAYYLFVEAVKDAKDHFNTPDQVKLLNYLIKHTKIGTIGATRFGFSSNKYIELLLNEKSHLRNQLSQDFEERMEELEPILWLLGKFFEQNKKSATQSAKYDRSHKVHKSLKRAEIVNERGIGLTIEAIRQSAIISEDSRLIHSPNLFNDPNVIAQSSNHSLSVHNTVYIDRSTAKEKIESDRLFVSRIGALMEQDANLMGNLLEETSVLDYNQALEVLGLPRVDEGAHERISKKIEELGIDTDLMDSFKANGKKIFLANKLSIALIIKYLEHIRANFDDVLNDDSSQFTKATLAARDYFYFSAILQMFPEEVRKEGEKYAGSLSFSYAKLSDLAGISKND